MREREAEEVRRKAEAREEANRIWAKAQACEKYPYLRAKSITERGKAI